MSFFNFDTTMPGGRPHNSQAPGFGPVPDAFASLSRRDGDDEEAVLDFEDTYDGLGDTLDDADDAFNLDTFGDSAASISREFDFSGQTANMNQTLQDEEMLYNARRPATQASPPKQSKAPARTGYEQYTEPGYIPQLEANASIWGNQSGISARSIQPAANQGQKQAPSISTATKKMMSLEEVEAQMRRGAPASQPLPPQLQSSQPSHAMNTAIHHPELSRTYSPQAPQILQRPQQLPEQGRPEHISLSQPFVNQSQRPPDVTLQASQGTREMSHNLPSQQSPQLRDRMVSPEMQNQLMAHSRVSQPSEGPHAPQVGAIHHRGPSYNGIPITHPDQLANLTEEERAEFLEEEARRAKRNHKIHLLSKDNGLMTPQDKNFITRIQLQQLLTATGNIDDQGPEAALTEDFYFHVYSQIRGAPRQSPNQPLSQFAQTYLYQTGGRPGNRRYPRGGESHMRRMEQQVQRAVEAAKLKNKNSQLVIEGSLGKISFSNAKTPKPLLNLKRAEGGDRPPSAHRAKPTDRSTSRKEALSNIEALYTALLNMEDHERRMPSSLTEESTGDEIQAMQDWRGKIKDLNETLWQALKVMEPIDPSSPTTHPFIAILNHPKGKKAIPRVFRQIDDQQRLTTLTMIVVHLDVLDVVRLAQPTIDGSPIPRLVRDEVDLFSHTVMPCLLGYINEAPMDTVIGLVTLIVERLNIQYIVRTRTGLGILTMFLSRAELIKESGHLSHEDMEQWSGLYDRLFDVLEGHLLETFTNPANSGDDVYVWQFLATMGIGAGLDQQQRLVLAVKDRVMDTVASAKTLPQDVGRPRLENVNLFMRALGLDVDYL